MQYPNLLKRIAPFALALILGLFAASFITDITPRAQFKKGRKCRQMKEDHFNLKMENENLKRQLKERESSSKWEDGKYHHYYLLDKDGKPVMAESEDRSDKKVEKELKKELKKELERLGKDK